MTGPTPGQTVGPFFGYALPYPGSDEVVPRAHPDAIRLHGQVRDGAGAAVPDALLETWQLAPDGSVVRQAGSLQPDGWTFTGFGRVATDAEGHYTLTTLPPGPSATGARFVAVTVFARGLLDRLFTRIYLPGAGLDGDPLLRALDPGRRATLVAEPCDGGYRHDIVLQGKGETVFLHFPRQ